MRWSNPADDLLRRSVTAGHTFARICGIFAEELGIELGRNAVIGRAFRLGIVVPRKPPKPRPDLRLRRRRRPPKPIVIELPKPLEAFSISLIELAPSHCRYPNEDASAYCGAPKADGSSYCAAHHRICYIKSTWHA